MGQSDLTSSLPGVEMRAIPDLCPLWGEGRPFATPTSSLCEVAWEPPSMEPPGLGKAQSARLWGGTRRWELGGYDGRKPELNRGTTADERFTRGGRFVILDLVLDASWAGRQVNSAPATGRLFLGLPGRDFCSELGKPLPPTGPQRVASPLPPEGSEEL